MSQKVFQYFDNVKHNSVALVEFVKGMKHTGP